MGVHYDPSRRKYVVRWSAAGRRPVRRFDTEEEALAFAEALPVRGRGRPSERDGRADGPSPSGITSPRAAGRRGDGIWPYETDDGTRWRFSFRQSDGTQSTRRGFPTHRAAVAAKRQLLEGIRRGEVKASRETFEAFWQRLVREKRPYMSPGAHVDLVTHGRKRLVPFFGAQRLAAIDEDRVREWLTTMVELAEVGELAAKTVNNARTWLSMAFGEAVRRGLMPRNPCVGVPLLPLQHTEIDFLRLAEIDRYLGCCAERYRPLAEFLIGTGARVSEAVAVRWPDLDLQHGVVRLHRQRSRDGAQTAATKGKRFRGVQIGPRLCATLMALHDERRPLGVEDGGWVFLCPKPSRGRYAGRTEPVPPHRKTVHDWHETALEDAGLRDMPLHSLRHTAAAAWLASGHPLIFVQRQLGHRSITTTEEHYGHLETSFIADAAARTEAAIASATQSGRGASLGRDLRI